MQRIEGLEADIAFLLEGVALRGDLAFLRAEGLPGATYLALDRDHDGDTQADTLPLLVSDLLTQSVMANATPQPRISSQPAL